MSEVPPDLRDHEPSTAALERAARAGLDLERLRNQDPERYRMLNAETLAFASPALADAAAELVWEAFPDRSLYRVPAADGGPERLLAFPPLTTEEWARFDDAAAELVARPAFDEALAYYRIVEDLRGTRRELMLPVPPERWHGETTLVGPFQDRIAAEAWPAGRLPRELVADPVPYRGHWFCDVFPSDEERLFGSSG